jgi:fatty acid elongase 3
VAKPKRTPNPQASLLRQLVFVTLTGSMAYGLWKLADVYQDVIDNYKFTARESFGHRVIDPFVLVVGYVAVIYLLQLFMKNRDPINSRSPVIYYLILLHNMFLSSGSLVMLLKIIQSLLPMALKGGWYVMHCDQGNTHFTESQVYFWYHVFYLSKVYEFLDTIILVLKKKRIIFLHVYHHIITLVLVWETMDDYLSVQWACISANALIHVFMYFYYMIQATGYDLWWKKYLTTLQILQFIFDEAVNLSWAYWPLAGYQCSGSWFSYFFGIYVIGSFLFLFMVFFKDTYKKPATKKTD